MSKINTGAATQQTQGEQLQALGSAGLSMPVQQLNEDMVQPTALETELMTSLDAQGEAAPAASPSPAMGMINEGEFDQIASQQESLEAMGTTAGMSPEEQAFQLALDEQSRESQRILPIQERTPSTQPPMFDISPLSQNEADGGLTQRAAVVRKRLIQGSQQFQDTTASVAPVLDFTPNSTVGKIATSMNAVDYDMQTGAFAPNEMFTKIMTIYAEDYFAGKTIGQDVEAEASPESYADAAMFGETAAPVEPIKPTNFEFYKRQDDPRKLGQQINAEYQRSQGASEDQIQPLDDKSAAFLGDYAKEAYAVSAGADKIQRVVEKEGGKQAVKFSLSGDMINRLRASQTFRDQRLPRKFVRPSKAPTRGGRIDTDQKTLTKRVTGQVGKGQVSSREIEEAMNNSGTIANVVRPERLKILLSTVMAGLAHNPQNYGTDPVLDLFADLNTFGPKKKKAYDAKQKTAPQGSYSSVEEIQKLKNNVAQNILGIAMERKGANYFQYFMQAFNGRLTPQASLFNPTTSKAVRFVTANAVPTIIKPASKMEQAAWQAYALVIGQGKTDALVPSERKKAMLQQRPLLEFWGDRLQQVMDNTMTDAEVEAVAQAIADGIPMNDPRFPKTKPMALDPEKDAELLKAIADKGDDGLAFIDGLIDFSKFVKAMKAGKPYASYLNPTIDGKTNGPASNGMQMGDERVAYRTGVLRTEDSVYAVQDNEDIRDKLQSILITGVEQGLEGHYDPAVESMVIDAAKKVFSYRDLNKAITMTFGYGKDFPSFIPDIEDAIAFLMEGDVEYTALIEGLESNKITRRDLAEIMLAHYVPAVERVMSREGILARHLLWGTALMHGLADIPVEMTGPTGLNIMLGGLSPDVTESQGTYKIQGEQRRVMTYEGKPTTAAVRYRTDADGNVVEDLGGKAWGGIIPAPVQAIDAATVVKTFSGRSWKKISQATNNNPYIHQIYDAFKFDIATYAVAAEEVNNNWARVSLEWSYLRETEKALDRAIDAIKKQLDGLPEGNVDVTTLPMLDNLLDNSVVRTINGKPVKSFPNLLSKLKKMSPYTSPADADAWAFKTHNMIVADSGLKAYSDNNKKLSKNQVKAFYNSLFKRTALKSRISEMTALTDKRKSALAKKVFADGNHIYQYFAH